MPSCFYVFMFVKCLDVGITGVEIYSSETGGWVYRQSEWDRYTNLGYEPQTVFFNGTLYSTTTDLSLASVDAEGKTWRKIRMPRSYILRPKLTKGDSFIARSQGRLFAMLTKDDSSVICYAHRSSK